ncbi:aldehyde dehydrogenase, dimeric NADP-preferring-like [Halichondria panicea]|uniref:aldehyde dehydrogenase, dimeric NADP-preferring-like n=1 Tax=Halichondria panicea TaxID=6063 RepID=UPI00312B81CD
MAQSEISLVETHVGSVKEVVDNARQGFRSRRTFPLEYRLEQLTNLRRLVNENLVKLLNALWTDLHKPHQETMMTEVNQITTDIDHTLSNLRTWMAPEHVEKDLLNRFNSAYLMPEPYGVVLIISPWNYPLMLSLMPLTGAIAAGNACVLKLPEIAVATSNLLAELIPSYLDKECYSVVTGGLEVAKEVCAQRFDYIFFTGSTAVGKLVMRSAAEFLTPLTLELGGKSPCIVADDADLEVAARRIMWGKCLNSGQSCVAPDYVLCSADIQERLAENLKNAIIEFFGKNPKESQDYGRIINKRAFDRICAHMDSMRNNVYYGGDCDAQERYISPTILTNVTGDDSIMSEEVFGPLLPVILVENVQKAIEFINSREKALALYLFTSSQDMVQAVTQQVSCGGITHNDTMLHCSVTSLPFGGVGASGFGAYHGKFSFHTFTHCKPVLSTSTRATLEGLNNIRYPPYSEDKLTDAQRLQTEGGVSRVLHLANLLTRSVFGRPRYRQPLRQSEGDSRSTADTVQKKQESNEKN